MGIEGPPEREDLQDMPGAPEAPPSPLPAPEEPPVVAETAVAAVVEVPEPPVEAAAEVLPEPGTKRMEHRIERVQDKSDMDRQVMRTSIDEMDRNIFDLQEKIDKEKDTGKAAKLRDQLTKDVAKRDAAYAEYKVMIAALDTKIAEIKKDLAEIQALKGDIVALQKFIQDNKADLGKSAEVAAKTHTLDEKQKELKKLTPEGREEDLHALLKVYEAERTKIREDAENRDVIGEADRALDAVGREGDAPGEEAEGEAEAADQGEGASEDAEGASALKKELLHNALHKAAYGMAVTLEKDYPGEDGNAYEKTMWSGKAFLLKVLVMFGGTPKWAELIKDNTKQREFLEKKVGIQFVEEDVKKDGKVVPGEKRWAAKFVKPVEGWEPGVVEMADVFETVYGKEGMAEAMKGITAETTLAQLEAAAAVDTSEENKGKTLKLIAAMRGVDANIPDGTKVQEFLTTHAQEVQDFLASSVTSVAETESEEALDAYEYSNADLLASVNSKKLDESSTLVEIMGPITDTPTLAQNLLGTIKTEADLARFSKGMATWKKDFALFDIHSDPTIHEDLLKNAYAEFKEGSLSKETSDALLKVFTTFAEGINQLMGITVKKYAEVMKEQTTNAKEKAEYNAILAALIVNNPATGEAASATP